MSQEKEAQAEKTLSLPEILAIHLEELKAERLEADNVYALIPKEGKPVVTSQKEANIIVRAMAEATQEMTRVKAQYSARLARVQRKLESLNFLFQDPLADWTAKNIKGKRKSIVLEDGTVGLRSYKGGVRIADKAALRDWVNTNLPTAVAYDQAPLSISEIAEFEKQTGKLAPGREAVPPDERFYIKFATSEKKELGEESEG